MTFPQNLSDRNKYILQCVQNGKYEMEWAPLTSSIPGHQARFWVSADALKIEGVRVNVSAYLQQQIADLIGASLLTVKLADLRFAQAQIRLEPHPRPITAQTQAMIEQSGKIDQDLQGKEITGKIIDTLGKHWCISDELIRAPKIQALNYGWHFAGSPSFHGIKGYPCDSGQIDPISHLPYHTIQNSATAHDYNHTDYSQIACLVRLDCEVDGQPMPLLDLLRHPQLSFLASHSGPMTITRQPSVPETIAIPPERPAIEKVWSFLHRLF